MNTEAATTLGFLIGIGISLVVGIVLGILNLIRAKKQDRLSLGIAFLVIQVILTPLCGCFVGIAFYFCMKLFVLKESQNVQYNPYQNTSQGNNYQQNMYMNNMQNNVQMNNVQSNNQDNFRYFE